LARRLEYGDIEKAFREAAHIVRIDKMHFHRFSSTPLENNAIIGSGTERRAHLLLVQQFFPIIRNAVHRGASGVPIDRIRVQTFDIGRQLRHQDHQLSAMSFARLHRKKPWPPGKMDRDSLEHNVSSAHATSERSVHTRGAR